MFRDISSKNAGHSVIGAFPQLQHNREANETLPGSRKEEKEVLSKK